jgi:lipid-A-disaccharide synthase
MSSIYFVAGEASGDIHGAELLQALRARDPQLQFIGRGGPKMQAVAGGTFRDWIEQAAVVGLGEVLRHYFFFRREFASALHEIAALRPDAVVLIDYPGFNLRLARALRKRIPKLKIIYYISPQVWAWNQGRVHSMARSVDLMLCIFPFEPPLYEGAGLRALFVGHPMTSGSAHSLVSRGPDRVAESLPAPAPAFPGEVESATAAAQSATPEPPSRFGNSRVTSGNLSTSLRSRRDEQDKGRDPFLVALFPGSRQREVKNIFPIMLEAARQLSRTRPGLHFEIAAASEPLSKALQIALGDDAAKFSIRTGRSRELMARAGVAMVASGTATLEAALSRLPFVLVYRVTWLTYLAARLVVKVRWLGMPNVLADREIVPELIQHQARPRAIARALARLLDDEDARTTMLLEFDAIERKLSAGETGANAAEAITAQLRTPSSQRTAQGRLETTPQSE